MVLIDKTGMIVNTHYDILADEPVIYVFGRLENNESFMSIHKFKPYFFVKKSDIEKTLEILSVEYEKTDLKNFKDEELVKIILKIPKELPVLRKLLEENNIVCYEADIPFTRRFLIDKKIQSAIKITGEAEKGEKVDWILKEPKLESTETNRVKNNLKLLSIDIETNRGATIIYAISLYGEGIEKVFVVTNPAFEKHVPKNTFVFKDEKELLKQFYKEIQEYDPDVITGWNFIDFDLQIIEKISKQYKIDFNIGRDNENSHLRIESSFLKDSKANANGRVVLDGIALVKSSFIELENYKLNTAAKEILGKEKVNTSDDRIQFIEDSYQHDVETFVKYNLMDSILVHEILHKSKVFDLTFQRSLLTGMHMDSVSASIASFDSIYLPKLHENKYVANSVYRSDVEQGLGGFVMEAHTGIYDNILILDFKSLYPSLMITFNIDPKEFFEFDEKLEYDIEKHAPSNKKYSKDKYIICPNGAILKKNKGILPMLIKELWAEREIVRKQGNELARYAIKTLMNSMYGVLASPKSRYFNRYLSNAITYFAQFFIKLTISEVEKSGYQVIYGDTDSIFVNTKTKDCKKALEIGHKIENEINKFLKEYISEHYELESQLELEFEKTFVKFFIPAKKRYAGLRLLDDGKTKLEFTGLEFVRKDWTELSKEFQMKLLDLIFKDEPVIDFISKFIKDLEKGKYDDLLVYKKSLSKPIESYTKTTPPHVKAAKLLDKVNSKVIEYIMTVDGPQPIQKITAKIDYEHYIDKQIKSIANGVLHVMDKDFDDLMKGHKQTGLGKFF